MTSNATSSSSEDTKRGSIAHNSEERPSGQHMHHTLATEAALPTSEEQLRLLLESLQDYTIFTLDLAGNVTRSNEGALRASEERLRLLIESINEYAIKGGALPPTRGSEATRRARD